MKTVNTGRVPIVQSSFLYTFSFYALVFAFLFGFFSFTSYTHAKLPNNNTSNNNNTRKNKMITVNNKRLVDLQSSICV